jgi:Ulp1 family protease
MCFCRDDRSFRTVSHIFSPKKIIKTSLIISDFCFMSVIKQKSFTESAKSAEYVDSHIKRWTEDHASEDKNLLSSSLISHSNKTFINQTILSKFDIVITTEKLSCLCEVMNINEDIINFIMSVENERYSTSRKCNSKQRKRLYFFNSSFYNFISTNKSSSDTKKNNNKINIFKFDKIFIPIYNHPSNGWTLVAINMSNRRLFYYDSCYCDGNGSTVLLTVFNWLSDEAKLRNVIFDPVAWDFSEGGKGIPQQMDHNDSGVFVILYADFIARGLSVTLIDKTKIALYKEKIALWILKASQAGVDTVKTVSIARKRPREDELIVDDRVKTACLLLELSHS